MPATEPTAALIRVFLRFSASLGLLLEAFAGFVFIGFDSFISILQKHGRAFTHTGATIELYDHSIPPHARADYPQSASASLGQLLLFRLRRLGIEAILLPSGGSEVLEGLSQARSDDLVVLFSFSKVSREGRMILEYQKQAGYRTLAFTSRSYLPEPDRADMNLFVYRGETKEYHSMTAPAALIDALVVAVSEKLGDEAVQRLSNLHRLKKAYDGNR